MATTSVGSGTTSSGLTVPTGNGVDVQNGGKVVGTVVQAGSVATNSAGAMPVLTGPGGTITSSAGLIVEAGGVDSGATIQAGATELVLGSASGDSIFGLQFVSGGSATVTNETVQSGGVVDLYVKGSTAIGLVVSSGGALNISGNAVASNTTLAGNATLSLQSPKASLTGAVVLSGTGNVLQVTALQTTSTGTYQFEGAVISGFTAGDVIDLTALASGTAISLTSTNTATTETVNVTSGGTVLETLVFTPGTAAALAADANGNVEVVACYRRGTRILTSRGEVAVEMLAVGDTVVTAAGEHRPVTWLGHNTVDCRSHPSPADVLPVRVRPDALGPGRPARELWLSPGHAVCVDLLGEVLVRIGDLVNGATIVQEPADSVEYWHVGLDSHDLLVAEGMPAESYIDVGNRGFFEAGNGLPDGDALSLDRYCRPLVLDEPTLAVLRARLSARAAGQGWTVTCEPFAPCLEVDGAVLEPELSGGLARFLVPEGAQDVWLIEPGFVPRDVGLNPDPRHLGVELQELRITDGLGLDRVVPATDPRLCVGVHRTELCGRVWTTPRALLPSELWDGCRGVFLLTVAFEPGAGRRVWQRDGVAPVAVVATRPALRLVHVA